MKDKHYYKLYVLLLIYNKNKKKQLTNIYFYKICAIVLFYNISTNI